MLRLISKVPCAALHNQPSRLRLCTSTAPTASNASTAAATTNSASSSARASREARQAVKQKVFSNSGKSAATASGTTTAAQTKWTKKHFALVAAVGSIAYGAFDLSYNSQGMLSRTIRPLYKGSWLESVITSVNESVMNQFRDLSLPQKDKLLPDWPDDPYYAALWQPGMPIPPAPPLLVLDFEKTLVDCVYNPKYGWTYAKRPGLDRFLDTVTKFYEVAIFCESFDGKAVPNEILMDLLQVDEKAGTNTRSIFFLGIADGEQRNGRVLKRLDYMNRDLKRVLLIDDSTESSQLFPENTINIKPYVDGDNTDSELIDMLPFLEAVATENPNDYRITLQDLGSNSARDIAEEYSMRITKAKESEYRKRTVGLGGIIRSIANSKKNSSSSSSISSNDDDDSISSSGSMLNKIVGSDDDSSSDSVSSSKQLDVGPVKRPTTAAKVVKKKGKLFEQFDVYNQNSAEAMNRKHQLMQEIQMKKMVEEQQAEEKKRKMIVE